MITLHKFFELLFPDEMEDYEHLEQQAHSAMINAFDQSEERSEDEWNEIFLSLHDFFEKWQLSD